MDPFRNSPAHLAGLAARRRLAAVPATLPVRQRSGHEPGSVTADPGRSDVAPDLAPSTAPAPLLPPRLDGRGWFIVFEGVDGSGKTTLLRSLATMAAVDPDSTTVAATREPGGHPSLGPALRAILLDGEHVVCPRAEALLFAADRAAHVDSVISPHLRRGTSVLCDRFIDSSLAYQGAGRGLPMGELEQLSSFATGGLFPDLVVVTDLDPSVAKARRSGRGGEDRMEAAGLALQHSVRDFLRARAASDPQRYLLLDADQPETRLLSAAATAIRSALAAHPQTAPQIR